jgi:hypothetical protein
VAASTMNPNPRVQYPSSWRDGVQNSRLRPNFRSFVSLAKTLRLEPPDLVEPTFHINSFLHRYRDHLDKNIYYQFVQQLWERRLLLDWILAQLTGKSYFPASHIAALILERSAVAFCDDGRSADDIAAAKVIIEWPGNRASNEKVPSRISYGPPPEVKIKWGYDIKPNDKARPHTLMKLKLDERMGRSKQLRMLLQFLASGMNNLNLEDIDSDSEEPPEYPGKSPVDVVGDYLSQVRIQAWSVMSKIYGPELFASLEKELVITVPAVWSERAKDQTLKAVQKANWQASKISIVTEPEAAAIYTLKYMNQGAQSGQINVGDHFVLCDAGGGTVDLISYKITKTSPTFAIEEAVVGSGDKCGATYVDKEFLNWVKTLLGDEAYSIIPEEKLRHGSKMMNEFEINKNSFAGDDEDEEVQVSIPRECGIEDDDDKNISDGMVTITW